MRVPFKQICQVLNRVLLSLNFEASRADRCAHIFTENTCDGVASHGLNRFPRFVRSVKDGHVDIQAGPEFVKALGAIEQWDGKRGIGIINAEKSINRAIELSRQNGIGCVGLRNTNHWLRGGTYGLMAAKAGCIGICWTNTRAFMPPWGAAQNKIGNNPMAISIPNGESPILLDMAMSQFSNGKLEVLRRRGEQLPLAGGYDQKGKLTTDPGAILETRRLLPVGYWKGSGLAVVLDIVASLIADGDATREISQRKEETGVSQIFMAIDLESGMGGPYINKKVGTILEDLVDTASISEDSKVRYPGQGMFAKRTENLEKGIPVEDDLWRTIQNL